MHISLRTKAVAWTAAGIATWAAIKALLAQKRKLSFVGKTVIITGGSRGLGLEMARLLAREGANLAICARQSDELGRARAELSLTGVSVFTQVCDVTDKQQVERFVQAVRQTLGPVDVLINNAGIISASPFEHVTESDFREAIDTHFWGAFYMTNAVLPVLRFRSADGKSSARIVNIASFGGKVSVPHLLPYSTSKFAMVGYSTGLRAALQKQGIYVTTVSPGLMRTGSPRNATFKGQHQKEYAAFKIGDSLPLFTMNSEQAARKIIESCRYGEAELILGLPAKLGNLVQAIAPELLAETLSITNELLPSPGGIGAQKATGASSETRLSSSIVTNLTDQAAERNNEIPIK